MSFVVQCTVCRRAYQVPDGSEGKSVRCTACGAVFPVGGAAAPPPAVSPASVPVARAEVAPARPAVQPVVVHDAAQAPPRPRRSPPDGAGQPARRSGALIAVLIVALVGLVLLVPAVGCLGVIAYFSLKTSSLPPQAAVDIPPPPEVPAPVAPAPAPVPPAPRPREPQAERPVPEASKREPDAPKAAPAPGPPAVAEDAAWHLEPDPLPEPVKGPADPNASIPIAGFGGQALFPTRPSDFVARNPPGGKDLAPFQVYDLRAMQPVGRPLGANGNAFGPYSRFALSPDGTYFAARAQGNPPTTVEVWSVITGDRLHGLDLG